ncbi:hypothetical protein ACH5RR_003717 [Cinchona calisaya]|uniref:Uncharacterized protein n=1 Tax=Cinchona calisaya TaxID=153742 RepID=A0ABD3AVL4_9GENT
METERFVVQKCRILSESPSVRTLRRKFLGLDRHLVHVAIPGSRGKYVRWNNFLDVLPHPQGLGPLFQYHVIDPLTGYGSALRAHLARKRELLAKSSIDSLRKKREFLLKVCKIGGWPLIRYDNGKVDDLILPRDCWKRKYGDREKDSNTKRQRTQTSFSPTGAISETDKGGDEPHSTSTHPIHILDVGKLSQVSRYQHFVKRKNKAEAPINVDQGQSSVPSKVGGWVASRLDLFRSSVEGSSTPIGGLSFLYSLGKGQERIHGSSYCITIPSPMP